MPEKLTPYTFAIGFLGLKIYPWQAKVMDAVAKGRKVALRANNESGKTSGIVAPLALWNAVENPGSTTVITTATFTQLKEQVFKALSKHRSRFAKDWVFNSIDIRAPNGSQILGRATNSGGRFEGFHTDGADFNVFAQSEGPLMIIADEAKTLSDDIFVAIDRCNPAFLLYCSSPGGKMGKFYEAFSKDIFSKHGVSAFDCPHISAQRIADAKEEYGESSEIYRSMILGEFSDDLDDGSVVPFGAYEECLRNPPVWHTGERRAFCDFAESSDENVLACVNGNKVEILDAWVQHDGDKDKVVARYKRLFREHHLQSGQIYGDASGMGYGYIYALRNEGFDIHPVENGDKASDPHYFNRGAEMWFIARKMIEECKVILPHDEVLKRQICSRKRKPREDGKLQLEPKKEMTGKSPDRADAVIGALATYPMRSVAYNVASHSAAHKAQSIFTNADYSNTSEEGDNMEIPVGADAGD